VVLLKCLRIKNFQKLGTLNCKTKVPKVNA